MSKHKPKILYVVNVDWFFISHRLPLALAAKNKGYDVYVAASDSGKGELIREQGLHFIPLDFSRKGTNILSELLTLFNLFRLYIRLKPDIVHHITIKPILFGSLIARFFRKIKVVNSITGLGYAFSDDAIQSKLGRTVRWFYRFGLNNPRLTVIFQNPDDQNYFLRKKFIPHRQTILIRGSGVNCDIFRPNPDIQVENYVLLASRMIWDKGIMEFYEAAKILKKQQPDVQFILAGMADQGNPNAVDKEQLDSWNQEGIVKWLGHIEDMVSLLQKSHLIVLPTYYPEGVPKILIEAASCGKAIITTDTPGCREIVKNGVNGLLIEPKDSAALADAVKVLLDNPEKVKKFGESGREIVLNEFSEDLVIEQTLNIYDKLK